MKRSQIKTIFYSIVALIIGVVAGFSSFVLTNSPKSDNLLKIASGELSVHFLEVGNKYTGDCIYIKANDQDILIDAGSRQSSATSIISYVNNYCTDGTLEYVVATHADQDHIAAFPSTNNRAGIFETYNCKNIIDFGTGSTYSRNGKSPTNVYTNYVTYRDLEIENGANYFPVSNFKLESFQKVFDLGNGITMTILENFYYHPENSINDQNEYSVCLLISNGANNILLTGDLEEKGEEKLVELNPDLPKCTLYKAGHHGSKTSSGETLLNKIEPENVVFTCCAGSCEYTNNPENTFPTQLAINRIAEHTKNCYVTSLCIDYDNGEYTSMNGNIVFSANKSTSQINCSNNNILLKDTEWFKQNRTCPAKWAS